MSDTKAFVKSAMKHYRETLVSLDEATRLRDTATALYAIAERNLLDAQQHLDRTLRLAAERDAD